MRSYILLPVLNNFEELMTVGPIEESYAIQQYKNDLLCSSHQANY